ncbi:MAG TPA: peptidoglycan bridge formation glycyltransferase FemA/FemB family protein, partial [Pyrinomonadaceae bacterium]|nr:peptidoglycan bridge formation glycyltransferase FemA/FemB family protein [Pyrinomonadaceae bacterium]
FYRLVAEYFTPALDEEFRSLQPMSLLVFEAMMEAARRGCEEWNWGGTWRSQAGVYLFKKRWGTRDLPYFYYTRVLDERLFALESAQLLEEYRWFYVFPFGRSLAAQS